MVSYREWVRLTQIAAFGKRALIRPYGSMMTLSK